MAQPPLDPLVYPPSTRVDNTIDPRDRHLRSFKRFRENERRRPITPERNTIYLVPGPLITPKCLADMKRAGLKPNSKLEELDWDARPFRIGVVAGYLRAFYSGMNVKVASFKLRLNSLQNTQFKVLYQLRVKSELPHAGTASVKLHVFPPEPPVAHDSDDSDEEERVKNEKENYRNQLESHRGFYLDKDDLFDYCSTLVPADARVVVFFFKDQIWSDIDHRIVYQASRPGIRVSLINLSGLSSPVGTFERSVRASLLWPISALGAEPSVYQGLQPKDYPILAATEAFLPFLTAPDNVPRPPFDVATIVKAAQNKNYGLEIRDVQLMADFWLYKVCTTAAHEVGHHIGIAFHCTNTCVMEDVDEMYKLNESFEVPMAPYLCPPCLEKITFAIHIEPNLQPDDTPTSLAAKTLNSYAEVARYGLLLRFCDKHSSNPHFRALGRWIVGVLKRYEPKAAVKAWLREINVYWSDVPEADPAQQGSS